MFYNELRPLWNPFNPCAEFIIGNMMVRLHSSSYHKTPNNTGNWNPFSCENKDLFIMHGQQHDC